MGIDIIFKFIKEKTNIFAGRLFGGKSRYGNHNAGHEKGKLPKTVLLQELIQEALAAALARGLCFNLCPAFNNAMGTLNNVKTQDLS